jgi:hypothetical protein
MSKGGMCKNPFGHHNSLNGLDDDFMAALFKGELTVDQTIALRVIKMSVRDYLFFGLGKNGITPERFMEAYQYLFKVRSSDPRTWGSCGIRERYRELDGTLTCRKGTLSPKEIQGKCFDTHFDISGLGQRIPLDNFCARLKKKREIIVNENIKQVLAYMGKYRAQEWNRLAPTKRKGKHSFPREGVVNTLVNPDDLQALGHLYLYGRSSKNKKEKVDKRVSAPTLKYKCLLFQEI